MRQIKLRSGLIIVVVAALLPVSILSIGQAMAELEYTRSFLGNRLIISALATAGQQRDQLHDAKRSLTAIGEIDAVRSMTAGCNDGLKTGMVNNASFLNLARSDAKGRVRCSVLPYEVGLSFEKEQWWRRARIRKGFNVSMPILGTITKREILVGIKPVYATDGAFDGLVTVAIDYSWLPKTLAAQKLAPYSVLSVVEYDGALLMASGSGDLPQFDPRMAVGRVAEVAAKNGAIWMYSAAPLYDRDVYVIYAEPRTALMETAIDQIRLNLILPFVALLLTILGIWFATNRLVIKWLDDLRALAAQFTAGNYQADTGRFDHAPEEMASLSAGLYAMASAVEQRDNDLNDALAAKTNMTLEIHHRVKNNLQIVSSLLNLQARRISDPAAKSALDQTRARIGALAQIHRLLYEDSTDNDHSSVDISQLMTQLCGQLRSLHLHQSGVKLLCVVDSHLLTVDTAVPLSLFAVEAVTNSYRHGFPDNRVGTIVLSFSVQGAEGRMQIEDDGIGFDPSNAFTSMGHQLMSAFSHQLGGTLDMKSADSGGTMVTLTYPLNGTHSAN